MHVSDDKTIAVIGLGYVGLPLAQAFSKVRKVIGFDKNQKRIEGLESGIDSTMQVDMAELNLKNILFTANPKHLREANFYIVTVPTPVDQARRPDLTLLKEACATVGKCLSKGDIVVFESTVYPGLTEEVCLPILEENAGPKVSKNFKIGYSPERINPGDKEHGLCDIVKVVAGQDAETLEVIAREYETIITAGVHRASSIKVAEAAKVIENTQRDLNIALMNELSIIFDRLGVDTFEVLKAAGTKWNFLKFTPGLVGGHCIGVDPYYLTYKAEEVGLSPQVILAGRRINDGMGKLIAQRMIKEMIRAGVEMKNAKVTILGVTFKENCNDIRNSKVMDIVTELEDSGIEVTVHDPLASVADTKKNYGIELSPFPDLRPADALCVAVAHKQYRELKTQDYLKLVKRPAVVVDVKGILNKEEFQMNHINFWRL